MDHAVQHSNNGSTGHEQSEANLRLIVVSAIGLAVAVAVVLLLMWGVFNILKRDEASKQQNLSPLAAPYQLPPEPRLQERPWEELPNLRAQEDKQLNGYTWKDQKAGIVAIPINKAMDLISQRGFPTAPAANAAPAPKGARRAR